MFKKVLLASALLVSTAAVAQTVVSWAKVNSTLANIAAKVKVQAPYLTTLDLNFEPTSDLNADILKFNLAAGTDTAAWSGGKAELVTSANMSAPATADGKRDLSGNAGITLNTKIVPALQYLLTDFVQDCRTPTPVRDEYKELNRNLGCGFWIKLGEAADVSDLRIAAIETLQAYQTEVSNFITAKEALLATETNENKKANLAEVIEVAKNDLKEIANLKISGSGNEVAIRYDFSWMADELVNFTFDVLVEDGAASATVGFNTKISEDNYQAYKQLLTAYVTDIETQVPETLEMIEQGLTQYAQAIEQFLTK